MLWRATLARFLERISYAFFFVAVAFLVAVLFTVEAFLAAVFFGALLLADFVAFFAGLAAKASGLCARIIF
ncbi:MAG: hypothetical protein ABI169_07910, partial [Chitinophagaceae bacterium]